MISYIALETGLSMVESKFKAEYPSINYASSAVMALFKKTPYLEDIHFEFSVDECLTHRTPPSPKDLWAVAYFFYLGQFYHAIPDPEWKTWKNKLA